MGTNLLELGIKLPLSLSELCVSLIYIENKITTSQSFIRLQIYFCTALKFNFLFSF
jgi:hypothetical protein